MDNLEVAASICGVMGFCLSVILAVREYILHRAKIRFSNIELYLLPASPHSDSFFIRCIVQNKSGNTISVSSVAVRYPGAGSVHPNWRIVPIIGNTSKKGKLRERVEFTNTVLPANLNPYESREMILLYSLPKTRKRELSLPVWADSLREPLRILQGCRGLYLIVSTSRRSFRFRHLKVTLHSYDEIVNELSNITASRVNL